MNGLFFIGYAIVALIVGWKYMDGRIAYLEKDGAGYKVLKFICAWVVGGLFSVFLFIYLFYRLTKSLSN